MHDKKEQRTYSEPILLRQTKKHAEPFWAARKYDVMARGYASYKQIADRYREAATVADYEEAMQMISHILDVLPYTMKGLRTSIEHMWGYVSKHVQEEERRTYQKLFHSVDWKSELSTQQAFEAAAPLLHCIKELAARYGVSYIKQTMESSFQRLTQINNSDQEHEKH